MLTPRVGSGRPKTAESGAAATRSSSRSERRVCPTCAFSWLDRYAKNECPKCLAPLVPSFKSLKARKEYEDTMASSTLRSSPRYISVSVMQHDKAREVVNSRCAYHDESEMRGSMQKNPAVRSVTGHSEVRHVPSSGTIEDPGCSDKSNNFRVTPRAHLVEETMEQRSTTRRVRFAPQVECICSAEDDDRATGKPRVIRIPLEGAVRKASSFALEDFETFKELLKQAPRTSGPTNHAELEAHQKDFVRYPEMRMSCPTCVYTWLDTTRKNECPKCWHSLVKLPIDARKCRAFI